MGHNSTEWAAQQDRILDLLKSRGYGQWVERYEFLDLQPRICDFTTRIFELRHKRDLNIQCDVKTADGEKHSRYRLLPGSWRELRGKPTNGERSDGESRHDRAERFSREFGLRPASHPWKTAFSPKRLAEPDCSVLTLPFDKVQP